MAGIDEKPKGGYRFSSPHFFRLIKTAFLAGTVALLILAWFFPAPLQAPADPGRVPNPVKSAWFLLWIQEVVSYSKYLVYPLLLLGGVFLFLPWLPASPENHRARWFPREQRAVTVLTLAALLGILILTAVALFFRGENWSFGLPF